MKKIIAMWVLLSGGAMAEEFNANGFYHEDVLDDVMMDAHETGGSVMIGAKAQIKKQIKSQAQNQVATLANLNQLKQQEQMSGLMMQVVAQSDDQPIKPISAVL